MTDGLFDQLDGQPLRYDVDSLLSVTHDGEEIRIRVSDYLAASHPDVIPDLLAAVGDATACAVRTDVGRVAGATIVVIPTEASSEWVSPESLLDAVRRSQELAEAVALDPAGALRRRYASVLARMRLDEMDVELGALRVDATDRRLSTGG